jgi:HEAT repeat protein
MPTIRYSNARVMMTAVLVAFASVPSLAAEQSAESKQKEAQLIETLRSGAKPDQALACKELAIHGTAACVPALAPLLADGPLASWARIALEAIPDEAAGRALVDAAEKLDGLLLVGVINSLGERGDDFAAPMLAQRLKNPNAAVASAAAVALGKIGNDDATQTLRKALADSPPNVRSAVAEGCILCAERLLADGKDPEAAALFDEIRKAEVPKQRQLEATRGSILARGDKGLPMLLEQLRSDDKLVFQIALSTARELPGAGVGDALVGEALEASPQRAALLLTALVDRQEDSLPAAVLTVASRGEKPVRLAAIEAIGRLGEAAHIAALLKLAGESDAEIAAAAKAALTRLPGDEVDRELAQRLRDGEKGPLRSLIEVVGERRIDATDELAKSLDSTDPGVRRAALTALGATIKPERLDMLVAAVVAGEHAEDAQAAVKALREACIRMPDREACAALLAESLRNAPLETKLDLLEILGDVGGPKALSTIAAVAKSSEDQLQDAGSRLLGGWMSADAAPVLLDLSKNLEGDKYRVRSLRGMIRLVRQFPLPEDQRAEMCQQALDAATRPDEQKLVLEVLERYPTVATLKIAGRAAKLPKLRDEATRVAMSIGQKLGDTPEAREALAAAGIKPVKVEIIKAQYGAADAQRDVTAVLQQHVTHVPLITLASANYNESFSGDPAPGKPKELTIEYRIDGEPATASFPENAAIVLPMPK